MVPGEFNLPTLALVGRFGPGENIAPANASSELIALTRRELQVFLATVREAVNEADRPLRHEELRRLNARAVSA